MSDLPGTADVVIVGGGSAGCVLAARLSQDPARRVLLLEAGPAYAPGAFPPALLDARILDDPRHDWGYTARATGQAPGIRASRGKVLGGSSAVNAGVAIRPRPADFAKWGARGAGGWTFAGGFGDPQPVQGEQRDQRMLLRWPKARGDQHRAEFVAVQPGGVPVEHP
jgi:choline dehydrogenase